MLAIGGILPNNPQGTAAIGMNVHGMNIFDTTQLHWTADFGPTISYSQPEIIHEYSTHKKVSGAL